MMLSQLSLSLDDHLERQIPALNHRAGMADVAGRNLLERANSRLESEFPDPKQTWDRMEENEDGQSTAEYDLAINGYINLPAKSRWRGADLRHRTWRRGFFPLEQNSEPVTPRMLFGPGLWMRSQKMVKHVEKGQNMLLVVTRLARADVINDHVTDFFCAVLLVR
jgi:hypothetical protein